MSDAAVKERLALRGKQIDDMRKRDTIQHYQELAQAKGKGIKVAWSAAGLVPTLLDALGVMNCAPENYSALCAWKQLAVKFNQSAEARGIPPDTCSYGRCIMGMMWDKNGPYGPLPDPDIVITDPTYCDAHSKMWEIPAHYYGAPTFSLDGVFLLDGAVHERDLEYRVTELKRLARFCEEHLGAKLDIDRFKENTRVEAEVRTLLNEIQTLRQQVPCPRSTRDMISEVFYIVAMPHSPKALAYFKLVAEDCRERVEHKIGTVENERFRVYWDNVPLWFWLQFYDYLQERGVVFASDAYSNSMFNGYYLEGHKLDPERPFESLALRQMYVSACSGVEPNLERYARLIEDWRCDGAVLFVNRSCKVATSGRFDKTKLINQRYGIPILEFEGEMADPTTIDKADVIDRANLFIEMLEGRAAKPLG